MEREDTGAFIKTLRKATGLTQVSFANRYEIPLDTLRKWEAGLRKPPVYVARLLEFRVHAEEGATR